jgi:hypothetical protein
MRRISDKSAPLLAAALPTTNSLAAAGAEEIRAHDPDGSKGLGAMTPIQRKRVAGTTKVVLGLRQLWSWYLAKGDEDSIGFHAILFHQCKLTAFDWMDFKADGKEVLDRIQPGEWTPPPTEAEKALADTKEWAHLDDAAKAARSEFPVDFLDQAVIPTGSMIWEMMRFIQGNEIRPQPIFRVSGALAWASNVFARKVRTQCGLRTNLYLLNVGRTACGKDAAIGCLDNAHLHIESRNGPDDYRTDNGSQGDSGLVRALAKCPALLSIMDEIGINLAEMLGGDQAHRGRLASTMMQLATAKGKTIRLPKYSDSDRDVSVADPVWTLFGATTESTLAKALDGAHIDSGFLPRCLVFWTRIFPEKVDPVETLPSATLVQLSKSWRAWFPGGQGLDQWRELPFLVPFAFSPEAKKVLRDAERRWSEQQRSGLPTAAMFSRAEENAKKVALILAANQIADPMELDSRTPKPIGPLLAGAACALVDWSIGQGCQLIQEFAANSQHGQLVKSILDVFERLAAKARADKKKPEPGIPAWMAKKNCKHIDGQKFDGIVRQLIETRTLADVTPPGRGGQLLCPTALLEAGK